MELLRGVQEIEKLVQAYYSPEATDADTGKIGEAPPCAKVTLPEDVQLLDKCAEAAQRLLHHVPYTADEVCLILFLSL